MKLTLRRLVVALVVGGALAVVGNYHLLAQQTTRTVLLKTDLVGISGYELQMVRVDRGPGEIGAKHPHRGTECFYVIEGAGVLDKEGQPPAHIKAGEAHCVPPPWGGLNSAARQPSWQCQAFKCARNGAHSDSMTD